MVTVVPISFFWSDSPLGHKVASRHLIADSDRDASRVGVLVKVDQKNSCGGANHACCWQPRFPNGHVVMDSTVIPISGSAGGGGTMPNTGVFTPLGSAHTSLTSIDSSSDSVAAALVATNETWTGMAAAGCL